MNVLCESRREGGKHNKVSIKGSPFHNGTTYLFISQRAFVGGLLGGSQCSSLGSIFHILKCSFKIYKNIFYDVNSNNEDGPNMQSQDTIK